MHEQIQKFFDEVHRNFYYLEKDFLFTPPQDIEDSTDFRTPQVFVIYLGVKVAVKVFWSIFEARIDVGLIELNKPYTLPSELVAYSGIYPDHARGILLSIYAEKMKYHEDPMFLLKRLDIFKGREFRQRQQIIQTEIPMVIEGLAQATRKYAGAILLGDTTMFTSILQYAHDR